MKYCLESSDSECGLRGGSQSDVHKAGKVGKGATVGRFSKGLNTGKPHLTMGLCKRKGL